MTSIFPRAQSIEAKRAESRRPSSGEAILRDESLAAMHRERAETLLKEVMAMPDVPLTPFLEVGAGSVQRSAALVNNYPVEGVAIDISLDSLRDAPYVLSLLKYKRQPLLICCDAHHLPFRPETFSFVFAFQTLHHFENPVPVVKECYRVLGNRGHFFFSEEPVDSWLRRYLRKDRLLSRPPTRIQSLGYRLGVQKLFWDDGKLERSLGMTEARFDLDLWRQALRPFQKVTFVVNAHLKINTDLYAASFRSSLAGVIGGNAKGLCQKTEGLPAEGDFRKRLMCLDCGSTALTIGNVCVQCRGCGRHYPIIENVIRMLPADLEAQIGNGQ